MLKTSNKLLFSTRLLRLYFLLLIIEFFSFSAISVFAQKGVVPNAGQMLKTHSTWPDALFRVVRSERLSGDRVWLQVQLVNPVGASSIVVSGEGVPIPLYLADKSGHPKLSGYAQQPYSLSKATIIDESTGAVLSVQPRRPNDPYPGLNYATDALGPNRGLIFGGIFTAPSLGVDHYPTIAIKLEKAAQPIKGVPVCDAESINLIDNMLNVKNADQVRSEIAKQIPGT